MESLDFSTLDMGQFAPGGLFETFEIPIDHQTKLGFEEHQLNNNGKCEELLFDNILDQYTSATGWMELTSDSMSSLLELQAITEVKTDPNPPPPQRASVIKSPIKKKAKPTDLTNIMIDCGIEETGMYDTNINQYEYLQSPGETSDSSEMEQNQELIDDLEDFFIQTEGSPTNIEESDNQVTSVVQNSTNKIESGHLNHETILKALSSGNVLNSQLFSEEDLKDAYTTSMTTEDGQNVIIIIAPSSPKEPSSPLQSPIHLTTCPSPSITSDYETTYETDTEWVPSPMNNEQNFYPSENSETKIVKKKYSRSKPPTAPTGPYPSDKKERKKAQNRTAAFRYREKKKDEQDDVDLELAALSTKNVILREKMTEMETEFKYLKTLMTEAGLGKYAAAVSL